MTNAKDEFLKEVKNYGKPVCASIGNDNTCYGDNIKWARLKENYTEKEYREFLKEIDYIYDSGYGTQHVYGKILFENSYSDRHEYDGAEGWENHEMPTPENVMNLTGKYEEW